jgi:hypothetical protein
MSKFRPSPEFEEKLRAAAQVDAPAPDAAFVQKLRATLREKATMKTRRKTILFRPAWAALALVLALLLAGFAIGPQRVAAAIQKWFGYIPGFGLVRNGDLRVVDGPVSITQEGVTLTVTEAILSDEKTLVKYSMEGIPITEAEIMSSEFHDQCFGTEPILRLPDGSQANLMGWGSTFLSPTGQPVYDIELTFASLPADVSDATLVVTCVEHSLGDEVPQNWEVPLHFVPAPPEMTVQPVLDVPTPTAQAEPGLVPAQDGMDVRQVIPTAGGAILSGTIRVIPPDGYTVSEGFGYFGDMFVTDAAGQEFACGFPPDDFQIIDPASLPAGTFAWACDVTGEGMHWPLTVTLNSVEAIGPALPPSTFQFDVGSDPQPDQVWQIEKDVTLGTKTVHIVSIQRTTRESLQRLNGYVFTFVADPDMNFGVTLDGYQSMGGGGGADVDNSGHGLVYQGLGYPDPVPSGLLTVIVNGNEVIHIQGPWQVTVELPAQ